MSSLSASSSKASLERRFGECPILSASSTEAYLERRAREFPELSLLPALRLTWNEGLVFKLSQLLGRPASIEACLERRARLVGFATSHSKRPSAASLSLN